MSLRRTGLVSGALLGGWGCLPPTAMPPPVPAGGAWGADVGVSGGIELETDACPLTQQPNGSWQEDCRSTVRLPPMGSLFYAQRLSPTWELGGAVFWSFQYGESLPSGAAFARRFFLETDRVRIGGHAELGFASVGVGIPAAVRVRDPLWLHSLPRVATSMVELSLVFRTLRFPVRPRALLIASSRGPWSVRAHGAR